MRRLHGSAGADAHRGAGDGHPNLIASLLAVCGIAATGLSAATSGPSSPLPFLGAAAALAAVIVGRSAVSRAARASAASAVEAESERRRIARDLHDGVAQTLAHLRLELDLLSRPEFTAPLEPDEIARLARVAERSLADVRGLIKDLAAPAPQGGLAHALETYVTDLQTPRGPRIEFVASGEPCATPAVDGALFRIAQEAISNAMRHANASCVRVGLSAGSGCVLLVVEDDGCGIRPVDSASPGHGYGMAAMRERAAAAGLSLTIQPAPGGGTRVEAVHAPEMARTA